MRVSDENGKTVESRTRLVFYRMENGQVDVLFYPVLKSSPLDRYDREQQKQLLAGKAILADTPTEDGRHTKAFVQIDPETKQVMSVPTPIIGRNLQVLAEELHMGTAEINGMQHGDPLTMVVDDEPVTVGIDLHAATGIRFYAGDEQKWREQSKREWDKYTFGVYGCWVMDDEGNLNYVSEEEYTEELWNEQKKSAERNSAAALHKIKGAKGNGTRRILPRRGTGREGTGGRIRLARLREPLLGRVAGRIRPLLRKTGLMVGEESAAEFVRYKDDQLEAAMEAGDA